MYLLCSWHLLNELWPKRNEVLNNWPQFVTCDVLFSSTYFRLNILLFVCNYSLIPREGVLTCEMDMYVSPG